MVTTASLQDRDGAFRITAALREAFSTITLVWADAGYTGRFVRDAIWDLAVAIVKRPDQAKGFVLLHRRWVVERSFAWLTKFRRLVRDYETLPAIHEAMIHGVKASCTETPEVRACCGLATSSQRWPNHTSAHSRRAYRSATSCRTV